MVDLSDIFASGGGRKRRPDVYPDIEADRLASACAAYHRWREFKIGDLVVITRGLRVASVQSGSEVVYVILDMFPDAPVCLDVSDLSHYGQRFDVYLGAYDEDGDFVTYPFDSRRLEPWPRRDDAER
jgi:hypothetical protein